MRTRRLAAGAAVLGMAGLGLGIGPAQQPASAASPRLSCAWVAPNGGCTYPTTPGHTGVLTWAGVSFPPVINGGTISNCEQLTDIGGGTCVFTTTGSSVTVIAAIVTVGVVVEV